MTIREYQNLLANLIAERDKVWNQIALLPENERKMQFTMFRLSVNAEMIREVSAVLAQEGKYHYPY